MKDLGAVGVGQFTGERGPVPISPATAHHEAGHATACEHFGLDWIIYGPNDEENFMGRTDPVRTGPPLPEFMLEDAAVIALAGWAAECHYLGSWDNPYVREGAEHDFVVLDELAEARHDPVIERAKALIAAEWKRVVEIADDMIEQFG